MDPCAKSEVSPNLGERVMDTEGDRRFFSHSSPGYKRYGAGMVGGASRQFASKQPCFAYSGYDSLLGSYGEDVLPCNSLNPAHLLEKSASPARVGLKANGLKSYDIDGFSTRAVTRLTNHETNQHFSSSNISQPSCSIRPGKLLEKVPQPLYNFEAVRGASQYRHHPRYSPSANYQKQDWAPHAGTVDCRAASRMWNSNYGFDMREKSIRNSESDVSAHLSRGPRTYNRYASYSSPIKELLHPTRMGDRYNLPDFQTTYGNAKFYVIKSYSEDDIHKCIKYHVWSSTPIGNKKLDAAYHDAEVKRAELASKFPIFLFFSVNASGQFVGLAEMTGKVDFNKTMDFWQADKWSGFFPVKWHIIKDIPNSHLKHIILENNDNRPVTYTRDTQEIELKPGLELLKIFKNYLAKTSILEDFDFYERRAMTNAKNKSAVNQKEMPRNSDGIDQFQSGAGYEEDLHHDSRHSATLVSVVDRTRKLSIS
ncbi:hypothetical protein Droror1_Dr00013949 [Drosera rotundifolia]